MDWIFDAIFVQVVACSSQCWFLEVEFLSGLCFSKFRSMLTCHVCRFYLCQMH